MQFAWDIFGEENFTYEIIEECPGDVLYDRELDYLGNYPGPLFNRVRNTRFANTLSEEGRRKRSEKAKQQHAKGVLGSHTWKVEKGVVAERIRSKRIANGSYIQTPESIAKMKVTKAANPWSEEKRAAQSERMKKQLANGLHGTRKPWTPERRAAQAERMRQQHKEGKL